LDCSEAVASDTAENGHSLSMGPLVRMHIWYQL
jgi:hypothetical protein